MIYLSGAILLVIAFFFSPGFVFASGVYIRRN